MTTNDSGTGPSPVLASRSSPGILPGVCYRFVTIVRGSAADIDGSVLLPAPGTRAEDGEMADVDREPALGRDPVDHLVEDRR